MPFSIDDKQQRTEEEENKSEICPPHILRTRKTNSTHVLKFVSGNDEAIF